MNIEMLLNILSIAITASIINTQTIQYIKDNLKINNSFIFALISFIIGTIFSITFAEFNIKEALWCGFISVIGAENLYRIFKGKFGLNSSTKE